MIIIILTMINVIVITMIAISLCKTDTLRRQENGEFFINIICLLIYPKLFITSEYK